MEEGAQAWGQLHSVKYVRAGGQHLAEPGTAKILQGGGCIAGTDHLHTAFGCCGTHHWVEFLALQPSGSDTCGGGRVDSMKTYYFLCFFVANLLELKRDIYRCSADSCRRSECRARCPNALR